MLTSLDPETFSKHIANQDAIAELVLKIIQVNEAFFKKEKQQSRAKNEVNESTWFDSIQYLIGCGHRPDDILTMSWRICRIFKSSPTVRVAASQIERYSNPRCQC